MTRTLRSVGAGIVFALILIAGSRFESYGGPVICNGCEDAPLEQGENCVGGDLPWSKHRADVQTEPEGRDLTHGEWKCGTCYQHATCTDNLAHAREELDDALVGDATTLARVFAEHPNHLRADTGQREYEVLDCEGKVVENGPLSSTQVAALLD